MERLKTLMIAALLAALAGSIALAATGGAEAQLDLSETPTNIIRISARQIEDGRIEFAFQQAFIRIESNDIDARHYCSTLSILGWSERTLPSSRYFPADPGHSRWLFSTSTNITTGATTSYEVRIIARRLADGRTEFGWQVRNDGEWSAYALPALRYFPADIGHSRWLGSSAMTARDVSLQQSDIVGEECDDEIRTGSPGSGVDYVTLSAGLWSVTSAGDGGGCSLWLNAVGGTAMAQIRSYTGDDYQFQYLSVGHHRGADVPPGFYEISPIGCRDGGWGAGFDPS